MSNRLPTRKVTTGGLAGAITAITFGVLGQVAPALEFAEGFEAAVTTCITFGLGYLVRD